MGKQDRNRRRKEVEGVLIEYDGKSTFKQGYICSIKKKELVKMEIADLKSHGLRSFRNIIVVESNLLHWQGLLVPDNPPYDKGAFRVDITFPNDYPFKPPKVMFRTKIYHPNVDERGQVCLPIVSPENWKPATKADQVIQALLALVNDPEPEHPLRAELAEEYTQDRKRFMRTAEEHTRKHAERRPTD